MHNEKLIKEIKDIIHTYKLNCDVCDFQTKCDFFYISKSGKLSDDFIYQFGYCLDWNNLLKYQRLSIELLEHAVKNYSYFEDFWRDISKNQNLTYEFVTNNKENINFKLLKNNIFMNHAEKNRVYTEGVSC